MECGQRLARAAPKAATTALVAAGLCLAASMLVPALLGFDRYVITGGSMAGTYDRGSLVYSREVPVSELRVGDVITYTPPPDAGPHGPLTHRIISIRERGRGPPVFRTKGDANAVRDPWTFRLAGSTQARAAFAIPYLGYAFSALAIREVRIAVIGVPAILVAIGLLVGLWRQAGKDARAARPDAGPRSGTSG